MGACTIGKREGKHSDGAYTIREKTAVQMEHGQLEKEKANIRWEHGQLDKEKKSLQLEKTELEEKGRVEWEWKQIEDRLEYMRGWMRRRKNLRRVLIGGLRERSKY